MSVLLVHEDSDREYLRVAGDELQTDLGVLEVPTDAAPGDVIETHLGERFRVRALRGPDLFDHFERTGAPMMPRDVGLVVGLTGAAAGDHVLDAGTGTGVLAAYLGRLGAEVISYERDPEFAAVARENMRLAGVDERVTVRTGDLTEAIAADGSGSPDLDDDAPFDLLTLDTGDAADVVSSAPEHLARGGYVAVYSPFVESAQSVADAAAAAGFEAIETLETIQREMEFGDRGSRPTTAGVGHTGYLTIARRT